jgi:glycine cleavage system H protein
MMSNIPEDLRFAGSHEWVREENGNVRVGISNNAQEQLGDMVFVEVPEVGAAFSAGDPCAVVESVKAASDIYCPVSGEVVEVNELLDSAPETINDDPYGEGWIFVLTPTEPGEVESLMSAETYAEMLEE